MARHRDVWRPGLALVVLLAACRGGAPTPQPSSTAPPVEGLPNPLPEIVARVNGQPVTSLAVASRARDLLVREVVAKGQTALAFRTALEDLVAREALFQEATTQRVGADDAAIDRAYNEARVLYPDDNAWVKHLADRGFDPRSYRLELRIRHIIDAFQQREADKVPPATDEEARAFYDAHPEAFNQAEPLRVRQIFIRKRSDLPEAWANERTKLTAIRERVRRGEDFASLARALSEDPASKDRGGEMPTFARGQMLPPFEEAAYALKAGEVSEIVETPIGFHIVKLEERLAPKALSFEESREQIKTFLSREKRDQAIRDLTAAVKGKAKVERFV